MSLIWKTLYEDFECTLSNLNSFQNIPAYEGVSTVPNFNFLSFVFVPLLLFLLSSSIPSFLSFSIYSKLQRGYNTRKKNLGLSKFPMSTLNGEAQNYPHYILTRFLPLLRMIGWHIRHSLLKSISINQGCPVTSWSLLTMTEKVRYLYSAIIMNTLNILFNSGKFRIKKTIGKATLHLKIPLIWNIARVQVP